MKGMWSLGGLSVRELLKRTARESWEDNVFALAATLAFYHFLALSPLILVLLIPFAQLAQAGVGMRDLLSGALPQLLPREAATVVQGAIRDLDANAHRVGWLLAGAAAGAVWAGMNASWAMIVGLNTAYETEENRSWGRVALVAGGLGLAVVLMVFAALVGTQCIGQALGGPSIPGVVTALAQWSAVVVILFISFALFYRFGPNLKTNKWRWSTPGAVFGVMLWLASTVALREYFNRAAPPSDLWPRRRRGRADDLAVRNQRDGAHRRRTEFGSGEGAREVRRGTRRPADRIGRVETCVSRGAHKIN